MDTTAAKAATFLNPADSASALPNHLNMIVTGADMMQPPTKLDADYYTAHDINGMTEGVFGSGSLNYLALQAHQNDALAQTMMTGEVPQETAMTNLASGIDTGHNLAQYMQMQGTAVEAPMPESGGNVAAISSEPPPDATAGAAQTDLAHAAAPALSANIIHDIVSAAGVPTEAYNGLNGTDGANGGTGTGTGAGGGGGTIVPPGNTITDITHQVTGTVTNVVNQAGNLVNNISDTLTHVLANPQGTLTDILNNPVTTINDILGHTGLGGLPGIESATHTLTNILGSTGLNTVTEDVSHTLTGILGGANGLLDATGLGGTADALTSSTSTLLSDATHSLVNSMTSSVDDAINTLANTINDPTGILSGGLDISLNLNASLATDPTTSLVGGTDLTTSVQSDTYINSLNSTSADSLTSLTSTSVTAGTSSDSLSTLVNSTTTTTTSATGSLISTTDSLTTLVNSTTTATTSGTTSGTTSLWPTTSTATTSTTTSLIDTTTSTLTSTTTSTLSTATGTVSGGLGIIDVASDPTTTLIHHTAGLIL